MNTDWAVLTGRQVSVWRLDTLVRSSRTRADYLAEGAAGPAWIQLVVASATEAEATKAVWRTASQLSHPNLVRILERGDTELDGVEYSYAALEPPEDDLSEVLAKRTLEADETRVLAESAAKAMQYLHSRGLRHGALRPSSFLILGENLKLSLDRVGPAGPTDVAADLKQFGETLVRAVGGSSASVKQLGSPYREIAAGCLDARRNGWTADAILSVLDGKAPEIVERTGGVTQKGAADVEPGPASGGRIRSRWVFGVIALAVALVGLFAYKATTSSVPEAKPVRPVQTAEPVRETPKDYVLEGPYGVIAATYAKYADAKGRAEKLAAEGKGLEAHVYPADGKSKRYYVLVGSSKTHAGAEKIRREARQKGAPSATYISYFKTD